MADIFDQVAAASTSKGDIFDQIAPDASTSASKPSSSSAPAASSSFNIPHVGLGDEHSIVPTSEWTSMPDVSKFTPTPSFLDRVSARVAQNFRPVQYPFATLDEAIDSAKRYRAAHANDEPKDFAGQMVNGAEVLGRGVRDGYRSYVDDPAKLVADAGMAWLTDAIDAPPETETPSPSTPSWWRKTQPAETPAPTPTPSVPGFIRRAAGLAKDPDVVGMLSPRVAHGINFAKRMRRVGGKIADVVNPSASASEASSAASAASTSSPSSFPFPVPETNGVPWGSSGGGPLALRGKMIPASEIPSAPTPRGEILPPSADQIPGAPYAPRPRATYAGPAPEPIPSRKGLMLMGDVDSASIPDVPLTRAEADAAVAAAQSAKGALLTIGEHIDAIKQAEDAKAGASDASTESKSVPVGKLPKSTGNPYAGPRTPEMQTFPSGNVARAGYHDASQTMVVEFRNGGVYEYRNVPREIFDQFVSADSHGSFLSRNVKGRYSTNFRGTVKPSQRPQPSSVPTLIQKAAGLGQGAVSSDIGGGSSHE